MNCTEDLLTLEEVEQYLKSKGIPDIHSPAGITARRQLFVPHGEADWVRYRYVEPTAMHKAQSI